MRLPIKCKVKRYTATENRNRALPRIIVMVGTNTSECHFTQGLRSLSASAWINVVIPPYGEPYAIAFGHHNAGG